MIRFLLIAFLVLQVWGALSAFFSGLQKGLKGEPKRRPGPPSPPSRGATAVESLARCAACGVHVPRSRALAADGDLYCTERCRISARARAG
jgi:hypothetical protein